MRSRLYPDIRPYRQGDEHQILALFRSCFGRTVSQSHWRWKLRHAAHRSLDNIWVAAVAERIVGHYAGIPTRLWLNDQERLMMVAVDGMIDPAFRRQGVYAKLVTEAHRHWEKAGAVFTLGLPNQKHVQAITWWVDLCRLSWQIRPLQLEALLAHKLGAPGPTSLAPFSALWNRFWDLRSSPSEDVEVGAVTEVGPDFDQLWRTARPNIPVSVIRDSEWIKRRYSSRPETRHEVLLAQRDGRPVGYLVYRIQKTGSIKLGFITDIFAGPLDAVSRNALLQHVLDHFKQTGVAAAITLAIPGTPLGQTLKRSGFVWNWGSFQVQLAPLGLVASREMWADSKQWILAGGDFDII